MCPHNWSRVIKGELISTHAIAPMRGHRTAVNRDEAPSKVAQVPPRRPTGLDPSQATQPRAHGVLDALQPEDRIAISQAR